MELFYASLTERNLKTCNGKYFPKNVFICAINILCVPSIILSNIQSFSLCKLPGNYADNTLKAVSVESPSN